MRAFLESVWLSGRTMKAAMKSIEVRSIAVGERHRVDIGNIDELAESMGDIGLLQPIGVTSKMALVWGERRLVAAKSLGWKEISAIVDPSLDDILRAAKAERDENTCRKPFTHSESVNKGRHIEAIESERAKERQGRPGKSRNVCSGNLPEHGNDTRDKVAAVVGMSGRNYEKAKRVVESGSADLVKAMDSGLASVDAAAALATLPKAEQKAIVKEGKEAIVKAASEVKVKQKTERDKRDPCDVVAARWIKSIHDALVPVNSVRRDLGGGKEWARTWDKKNLKKMANELRLVIKAYEGWLAEIEGVLDE